MKWTCFTFWLSSYWLIITMYRTEASSNIVVTSPHYVNTKMVLESAKNLPSRNISKLLPEISATIYCSRLCALESNCLAFNFCQNDTNFYTCELLPSHSCLNNTVKTLLLSPGCSVWDKLTTGQGQSCVESGKFYTNEVQTCEKLRPGCNGTWPKCSNCAISCSDAFKNTSISTFPYLFNPLAVRREILLWPGNNSALPPILGRCSDYWTILMRREVEPLTGKVVEDYRMSFKDINRLYQTSLYKRLRFVFRNPTSSYISYYSNSYIDENGTISNLMLSNNFLFFQVDLFKTSFSAQRSFPFVSVTDDRYGCGSFWLLNVNNATYCPGGNVGMFGTVRMNGNTIVSTGMKCPNYLGPIYIVSVEFTEAQTL